MAFSAPDTDISPLKLGFSVPESDLPNGGFHAPQSDLWNIDPGTKLGIPTEFSGGEENKFSPDNPDAAFTRATEADPTGALAGLAVGAIQNGLIEPAAAKLMNLAMVNLPAQPGEDSVAPAMPPIQPGVPLIPPPDGKGVLPALGRFASNFTTPGQLLTLPLAPESDLIKGFFATGAAAGIQPALEKFAQSQTPEDRNDAATELGLNVGMAALLGHGLGREHAAPGEQAIADQGAQSINQAAESAFSPLNEVKAAEMAANPNAFTTKADLIAAIADLKSHIDANRLTKPPGEAVQPSEAPPGVPTPPAAETPPGEAVQPSEAPPGVPTPPADKTPVMANQTPLGLNRPVVANPDLAKMSAPEFDLHYRQATQAVDAVEKAMDQGNPPPRDQIAAAQDAYSAANLESYRRNVTDMAPEDLFDKLRNLAPNAVKFGKDSEDYQRSMLLMDELERQGATKEDILNQVHLSSPDAAEVFAGDRGDIKTLAQQRVAKPPVPITSNLERVPQSVQPPTSREVEWRTVERRSYSDNWESTLANIGGVPVEFSMNGDKVRIKSESPSVQNNFDRTHDFTVDFDKSGNIAFEKGNIPPSARAEILKEGARIAGNKPPIEGDTYLRYGNFPKSGQSKNHVTGQIEKGVSVYRAKWNPALSTFELADANHPGTAMDLIVQGKNPMLVHGENIGRGSDGEPVLKNPSKIADLKYTGKGYSLKPSRGPGAAAKEVENPTSQRQPTEKPLDTPASATDKAAEPAEAKHQTELPGTETPISRGPGAAAKGEPGTYPPIQRMTDYLKASAEKTPDIDSKVGLIDRAKLSASDAKDAGKALYARVKAVKDALWDRYKAAPPLRDDNMGAVGKWFRALQESDQIARNFAKQIVREVPDKLRREAITNWIQADGDEALLNERADASKGRIAAGYRIATKLTPREKEIAGMLRDYYDQQLETGLREGLIKHSLPNYITQVWKRENPITQKLVSDLSFGKLTPNFKFARKRIFDSYFEGEQAGYTPNKDAGFLVANYDQTFNRALAARAFIKDLHAGKASDGRPLVELSGEGHPIEDEHGGGSILVNPHAKPEDIGDYRTIDHPALRGWKWLMKTDDGKSVFVRGNMLVHPEIYDRLKNRLTTSWFQRNPVARALMAAQTSLKQTLFSVPGFHQVQETLHALGHRIDPANLEEVDFSDPVTKALAEHGLQLADYNALAHFSEGLAGGGLVNKLPYVGPKLHAYNEWLFQDHIPKLKLAVAKISLERNRETYPKWNEDQQLSAAASIANDAFGELPYRYWGSNPNMIDAFRAFLLAPDFAASRARFVARALRPGGREQLTAIGVLALTQYTTARAVNQALNGDAHLEPQNMFRIIYKNHAYSLRTIPSDLLHMFNEPRGFFSNRMSLASRAAFESITGRDYRGVKRDFAEQVKDMLTSAMPISVKPLAGQKWWQAAMNNFGVQDQRWDAVQALNERVQAWKAKNAPKSPVDIVYDADNDRYAPLKRAVEDDDQAAAKKEYAKLVASTPPKVIPRKSGDITESPEDQVQQHFKLSYNRPFTGSKAYDEQFLQSLDATGKQEYQEASDLRQARFKMIQSLRQ